MLLHFKFKPDVLKKWFIDSATSFIEASVVDIKGAFKTI